MLLPPDAYRYDPPFPHTTLNRSAAGAEAVSFPIGGATVPAYLLVSQALALAGQEESPLDVTAGNDALGGGGSAYDDNLGSILDLLIAQGVIPPTERKSAV